MFSELLPVGADPSLKLVKSQLIFSDEWSSFRYQQTFCKYHRALPLVEEKVTLALYLAFRKLTHLELIRNNRRERAL